MNTRAILFLDSNSLQEVVLRLCTHGWQYASSMLLPYARPPSRTITIVGKPSSSASYVLTISNHRHSRSVQKYWRQKLWHASTQILQAQITKQLFEKFSTNGRQPSALKTSTQSARIILPRCSCSMFHRRSSRVDSMHAWTLGPPFSVCFPQALPFTNRLAGRNCLDVAGRTDNRKPHAASQSTHVWRGHSCPRAFQTLAGQSLP